MYNLTPGANVFYDLSGGAYVSFDDCWITSGGTAGDIVFNNTTAILYLNNILGVPGTSGLIWVSCSGGSLIADRVRFGGEAVSGTCVQWSTPASFPRNVGIQDSILVIQNSSMYTSDGADTIKFYTLPNRFVFENNYGMNSSTTGMHYDSTIPLEQRAGFVPSFITSVFGDESSEIIDCTTSDPEITNLVAAKRLYPEKPVLTTDLYSQFNTPVTVTAIGCTTSAPNDPFGVARYQAICNSAGNLNLQLGYGNPLTGIPAGDYTAVFDVEIIGSPITVELGVGGGYALKVLEIGHNIAALPFSINSAYVAPATWSSGHAYSVNNVVIGSGGNNIWRCSVGGTSATNSDPDHLATLGGNGVGPGYTNTDTNGVAWTWVTAGGIFVSAFGGISGSGLAVGRIRVFKHHPNINNINTVSYGSSIPGSGQWYAGDVINNVTPTSGNNIGWVCTASGSPGTWIPFGTINGAVTDIPGNLTVGTSDLNQITLTGTGEVVLKASQGGNSDYLPVSETISFKVH